MSSVPLDITAQVRGRGGGDGPLRAVRGQVQVASTAGEVVAVSLDPPDPPACSEAVAAVGVARWVVLGPGSWFTSVIPHLLVPGLFAALHQTPAQRLVVLNLAPQPGETDGFSPDAHLEVLAAHAPELRIDVVLADVGQVEDTAALERSAAALGASLVMADVAARDGSPRHDPARLAGTFREILGG